MTARLGIAHHLGWAVAVTAAADHAVLDRRRIELIGPGLPAAPIHHEGGAHPLHRTGDPPSDAELTALVAEVRASAVHTAAAELAALADSLGRPIVSISLRAWPDGFPDDLATRRRVPYESRADSVMYLQVLAAVAGDLGWAVHHYDSEVVESEASEVLGDRATEVLHGPRSTLGPPWTKDHRMALAATVLASRARS